MSKNDWTNKLRDRLAEYQEPVKEDLWASVEQSLSQYGTFPVEELPRTSSFSSRIVVIRRLSMAAAITALAIGGTYVYLHSWRDSETKNKVASVLANKVSRPVKDELVSCLEKVDKPMDARLIIAMAEPRLVDSNLAVSDKRETTEISSTKETEDVPQAVDEYKETVKASSYKEMRSVSVGENEFETVGYLSSSRLARRKKTGVTLDFYGENGFMGRSANGLDVAVQSGFADAGASLSPDPTQTFVGQEWDNPLGKEMLEASRVGEVGEKARHHQPIAVGMQVGFGVAPRLRLMTGLSYIRASSDFEGMKVTNQVLHYVAVPLQASYEVWGTNRLHSYLAIGGEGAINVKNKTESDGEALDVPRDRMQWSVCSSVGLQWDILPQLGVYVEPGLKYYFDNGSQVENIFKDKKLNYNLQFGLRWNVK